jgi:hypothetical protein
MRSRKFFKAIACIIGFFAAAAAVFAAVIYRDQHGNNKIINFARASVKTIKEKIKK